MRTTVAMLRRLGVALCAVMLTLMLPNPAFAYIFTPPKDISNREKAHLNISFTGGGTGSGSSTTCSVSGGDAGDLSADFSLGTDPKERRINLIKSLMSEYGLTAEQASGAIGNFMQESGGEHLPPDVNQGATSGAPPNGSSLGYGWAQWSGGRKYAFVAHINDTGYKTADGRATDAADYSFLLKELNGSYKSTVVYLKKQTSPEQAALSFHTTFEKSGDNMSQITERASSARKAFNEYKAANGETGTTGGGCGTASSANFGQVAFPLKGSKKVVNNPEIFHDGTTDRAGHPYTAYDIMSPGGTQVVAFASGTVSYFFNDVCGGDSVTIWNDDAKLGVSYLHMQPGSINLKMNDKVTPGQPIGTVGRNLPNCNGDHLHIDAATDKTRQACSRSGCSIADHFRDIGKELYTTFEALPDN